MSLVLTLCVCLICNAQKMRAHVYLLCSLSAISSTLKICISFQVYYDMYERSKEKYVAEMQIYNKKTEDTPCQMPLNIT